MDALKGQLQECGASGGHDQQQLIQECGAQLQLLQTRAARR
jgi:hypothetical protein